MAGSGGFRGGGGLVCWGAGLAGEWLHVEGQLGGVGAAIVSVYCKRNYSFKD